MPAFLRWWGSELAPLVPEIRDLLEEAGFRNVTVYWQGWDEDGEADGDRRDAPARGGGLGGEREGADDAQHPFHDLPRDLSLVAAVLQLRDQVKTLT